MKRSDFVLVLLVLALGMSLAACDTSKLFGNNSTPSLVYNVTAVTVSPKTATIQNGATQQLTATVAPSNATYQTVTWTSSVPGTATVSATGLVTGVSAGATTVTVTTQDGLKTDTCVITVTP